MNDGLRLRMDWATTRDRLGASPLDVELKGERASALGRAGARLERALAREPLDPDHAAQAAWEFMVLREMAGLHDWAGVVRHYGIPKAVLNRMGARVTAETGGDRR